MDFFDQQRRARRWTGWLILLFVVAIFLVGTFVHCAVMVVVLWFDGNVHDSFFREFWQHSSSSWVFGLSQFFVASIVCVGSLIKMRELSLGGGEYVAEMLGGREVSPFTLRFEEKQLLNIVEEMSIAAGTVIPAVYILDREYRINSFAAGFERDDAVIGLTRGAVDYLNRDELQAIVAHEFSHILNGDIVLNMRMIGVLYGLNMITQLGVEFLRRHGIQMEDRGSLNVGDEPVPVVYGREWRVWIASIVSGLILITIGLFACLLGSLIKAAISRQRERLADASAIQFTRNPGALKSAFMKIGCPRLGSIVYSAHALEASHLFVGGPFGETSNWNLFSTHPTWKSRIRRFDRDFNGRFPERVSSIRRYGKDAFVGVHDEAMIDELLATTNPRLARSFSRTRISDAQQKKRELDAAKAEAEQESAKQAKPVEAPSIFDESFRTPKGCCALIIALLLDKEELHRKEQLDDLDVLTRRLSIVPVDLIKEISQTIVATFPVDQTMTKTAEARKLRSTFIRIRNTAIREGLSKLQELSPNDYADFRLVCSHLTGDVNKINLFRYSLFAAFRNGLDERFQYGKSAKPVVQIYKISGIEPSLKLALSYLAYAGHSSREEAGAAFQAGLETVELSGSLLPISDCVFRTFDDSLRHLQTASPPLREKLLDVFKTCLWNDGIMTAREEEIFLAVRTMLD